MASKRRVKRGEDRLHLKKLRRRAADIVSSISSDDDKFLHYRAVPCNCGYDKCPDWHVTDVANVHGVHFTKKQAEDVALVLNATRREQTLSKKHEQEDERSSDSTYGG